MPILLRHPPLSDLAKGHLTYPEVGATALDGELPAGYRRRVVRAALGEGRRVFDRCAAALMTWDVHRAAGLDVRVSHSPVQRDAVVSQLLGARGLGIVAPCRVVYVVDEDDRRGFAYGTLRGHPETGEEAFVVALLASGEVVLEMAAFSRSASVISRLGGPVTRRVQDWMTDRYVDAAQQIAGPTH